MRVFISVLLFLLISILGNAQVANFAPRTFKCPVDGNVFFVKMGGNYSVDSTLTDLQKAGSIKGMYENMIIGCPKCYYSGYENDFSLTFSGFAKKEIKKLLLPFKQFPLTDLLEVEIAAAVHQYFGHNNDNLAYIYLIGSYIAKNEPYTESDRIKMQKLALESYLKAIDSKEYTDSKVENNVYYLVGELYRRTSNFEKAIKYFDIAFSNVAPSDWIYSILPQQKQLAEEQSHRE